MKLRTFLHDAHQALGARMVEFGGWVMPLSYGSQIEEHHAVRQSAGMFDISHMLAVDLEGPDARVYLSRLLANDVARLAMPGGAFYTCMLNENGGIIDDLIVYCCGEHRFRAVVNAANASTDFVWMESCRDNWGMAVSIVPRRDLAMIAVQGPEARSRVWQAMPETRAATEPLPPFRAASTPEGFIARTGYTGEDGFEIMLPGAAAPGLWQGLLDAGVTPCGLGARDTLRLEAGMNLHGQDMDENTSPLDSGLAWTVALADNRDFVGKTALLRQGVTRRLLGLMLLGKGVLRSHQSVHSGEGMGEVTSGSFSPTLRQSIALARLPPEIRPGDTVEVAIRANRVPARVVKPPFVRHGRILI